MDSLFCTVNIHVVCVHVHLFSKNIEYLMHAKNIINSFQQSRMERLWIWEPDNPG